jgi:deazaflavin-dependent oxidoreductase (nitroreductase family)
MQLPRGLARFNRVVTNRVQRVYAWALPPWAVIVHRGRRSGRTFRTPVLAFRSDGELIVALLYGDESDWLRNLLAAGGGRIVRGAHTYELSRPRVVATDAAAELDRLPPPARAYCRVAEKQMIADLGARVGRAGPGPSASPRR